MPAPTLHSLLDRVDDTDQPIGRVQRGDVFRLGAGFRVVHVLVQDHTGRLLLQQVGRARERHPLRWGSSVAGYVHAGESYVDAARRRLSEELGLDTPLTKLGAVRMPDSGAVKFVELYCTVSDDASIEEPEHIERIAFWSLDDLATALDSDPGRFTPTFLYVFALFRVATGGDAG